MKDFFIGLSIFVLMGAFFGGMISLLRWDATNDAKYRQDKCAQLAEFSKATFHAEKDYTCTLLIDGEVKQVEV